jgi:hypothetical protein
MSEQNFSNYTDSRFYISSEFSLDNLNQRKFSDAYWALDAARDNFNINTSAQIKDWLRTYIRSEVIDIYKQANRMLVNKIIDSLQSEELLSGPYHDIWVIASPFKLRHVSTLSDNQPIKLHLYPTSVEDAKILDEELARLRSYQPFVASKEFDDIPDRAKKMHGITPYSVDIETYKLTSEPSLLAGSTDGTKQVKWTLSDQSQVYANNVSMEEPVIIEDTPFESDFDFGFDEWDECDLENSRLTVLSNIGIYAAEADYIANWAKATNFQLIDTPLLAEIVREAEGVKIHTRFDESDFRPA